jgi:hypothetical protein
MTPPTDLQAKAPKELREEIERLVSIAASRYSDFPAVRSALRELAAFCYRDAAKECRALGNEHPVIAQASIREVTKWCAKAIARRAKEVT